MKQQIIVIRGGMTFGSQQDYMNYLQNKEVNLERLRTRNDWKDNLQSDLGENYDVLVVRMPNRENAHYEEWKIWFEKVISVSNDNLILIGQSLGGIFLAKYLSENILSKKIKVTMLVASPFDHERDGESLIDFKLPSSLSKFGEQSELIYLLHSGDDPIVPFEEVEKYKKALPSGKVFAIEGRGHFNQESFPEIVELIKETK